MQEEELKTAYLCFVRLIGDESDGYYRYEFIFTDRPDEVWGDSFEYKPACMINDLIPDEEYIYEIHTVKTKIKFDLIQDNCCFGFTDCMDGCVSICYEDIDDYEEYPSEGRLVFMFGEELEDVERKLAKRGILMLN